MEIFYALLTDDTSNMPGQLPGITKESGIRPDEPRQSLLED